MTNTKKTNTWRVLFAFWSSGTGIVPWVRGGLEIVLGVLLWVRPPLAREILEFGVLGILCVAAGGLAFSAEKTNRRARWCWVAALLSIGAVLKIALESKLALWGAGVIALLAGAGMLASIRWREHPWFWAAFLLIGALTAWGGAFVFFCRPGLSVGQNAVPLGIFFVALGIFSLASSGWKK